MKARSKPPLVLGNLRVLGYAASSEVALRKVLDLLDRGPGGRDADAGIAAPDGVRNLLLGERLDDPATLELLYCDGDWTALAQRVVDDAAAARALVEHSDSGDAQAWRQLSGTREDALVYYDELNANSRCSFCSKRAFQVALLIEGMLIEGTSGIVCNECIARFLRATQAN